MNLEHAMSTPDLPVRTRLSRHEFLRFRPRQPLRLRAECGTLWVTLDGHPEDIEIDSGHGRTFDGRDTLTVGTLGGDAVLSATALPAPQSWAQRWLRGPLAGRAR
jgi:hypothetical protein